MSMHKIPLTRLEEAGLRAHGLDVGTPSQLSDAFRQGVKWAQRNEVGIAPREAVNTNLANLYLALESLLDCPANVVEASVPKAGIDAAPPHQVVLDVSMSLTRRREALAALQRAKPLAEVLKTLLSLEGLPMVDVHKQRAAEIFNIPESEVTAAQRRQGKAANFYCMYNNPQSLPLRAAITIKAFDSKED